MLSVGKLRPFFGIPGVPLPLPGGVEAGAAESVPGAVGVARQAAVRARRAIGVAAVQRHLRDAAVRANVQLLLRAEKSSKVKGQGGGVNCLASFSLVRLLIMCRLSLSYDQVRVVVNMNTLIKSKYKKVEKLT